MTNNTFSFNRFGNYFRLYMAQHGRLFVQCVLAGYMMFSLIFTIFSFMTYSTMSVSYSEHIAKNISSMTSGIALLAVFPIMSIVGSHMMHVMANRPRRLQTLTLPASALEKFLSYWIVHVVLFFIGYFVMICCADLTRTVLGQLFYPALSEYITVTDISEYFKHAPNDIVWITVILVAWLQSYFILGSTVWSRFSFFKTLGCGIIGFLIITFSITFIASKTDIPMQINELPEYTLYIAIIPTLFNWYMGYRRFKEAELVPQI